ncbi:hypothetical protein ACOMHN_005001 [Nucella lapillus]
MEIRPAVSAVRQLVRCVKVMQQTCLPVSTPVTSLCLRNSRSDSITPPSLCSFFSMSSHNGARLETQGSKADVLSSWRNAVSHERQTAGGGVGSVRGMAGHSKWANIRHIKAAKDQQKARVISEYSRKIRAFIRETGQHDPKKSSQLARLLAEAKTKNVPNANIDRVLSQMVNLKNSSPVMFEAKGPSGSVMLIEALTAKMTQTKSELQSIVKKCGFSMFDSGSLARMAFEEKGVIEVGCPDGTTPDLDPYIDIAIEAGAEDVTLEDDEEGNKFLQFLCDPGDLYAVKKELEARQLAVRSAEAVFNSTSVVALDSSILELIAKAMEKLDEHPDVLRVYINVEDAS